jgi:hypothetical protein
MAVLCGRGRTGDVSNPLTVFADSSSDSDHTGAVRAPSVRPDQCFVLRRKTTEWQTVISRG